MTRLNWENIVEKAADLVHTYGTEVTLRQLFYRLVSDETLPNTTSAYKTLSARTAEARREDYFPALTDRTRRIHNRYRTYTSASQAVGDLPRSFRLDRTEGQEWSIYLGVEKDGIVAQLESWFGDLGIPIVALRGYSSQTYCDDIVEDVESDERPAVLIYAGDFDPSGEDIERDFHTRTEHCFEQSERIALTAEQVVDYQLPPQMGKATDTRAGAFVARHGQLIQVEVDALSPATLQQLYSEAIDRYWDKSTFKDVLEHEDQERQKLVGLAA